MRFPITPTKIKVTLEKNNAIRITNGEQTISVTNAAIKPGDQLVFDFADEKLMVNDEDWTSVIDLESDFENFVLRQGQKVVCNNGKLKVFYRGATI
ncbi:phage distal tail protein [Enterococcus mundtii]